MAGKNSYDTLKKKIYTLENEIRQYRRRISSLMGNLPGMTYICENDEHWTMQYVSEGCLALTGYEPMELIDNRSLAYIDLIHPDDQLQVWVQIQDALAEKKIYQLVYRIRIASGEDKWVWEQGLGVFSDQGELQALAGFISDLVNHSLLGEAESRLGALIRLNRTDKTSMREVIDFALEEALRLTESSLGYFAFVNEDTSMVTSHAQIHRANGACGMRRGRKKQTLSSTGLWGESVRQRRPIITNDYAAPNPLKTELPDGHIPVTRHLSIPIFENERIIAVAGVGNKEAEYDHSDAQQLTLLMSGIWRLVISDSDYSE
jgi:two-component system, OmpR family, phosphate regulon sensor histidine kinase PhoR